MMTEEEARYSADHWGITNIRQEILVDRGERRPRWIGEWPDGEKAGERVIVTYISAAHLCKDGVPEY